MSLTMPGGPLASQSPEEVNYEISGPKHRLLMTPFPRRVRAQLGGETVLDTRQGKLLHESNILPRLYVPEADVRQELLEPTDHSSHCPFKGDASYWTVRAGGKEAENAAWAYPEPFEAARWLRGHLSFYPEAMDTWIDEDEPVEGHLRDPYHRVDVRASSSHVRVLAGEAVIAESERPMLLSETALPNRYYLPREDVKVDLLEPSEKQTVCPYKGNASFFHLGPGAGSIDDAAWSYPEPLEGAAKVADHLCFLHDDLRLEVDGVPLT